MRIQAGLRSDLPALAFLALAGLLVGARLASNFGSGWDERGDSDYGRFALRAYAGDHLDWEAFGQRKYYGPFYFMLQEVVSARLDSLIPSWSQTEARHFVNFMAFVVGTLAFYFLLRRMVGRRAALVTTLLFASQPLYFGHGFINQKDVPFMSSFLLALLFGVESVRGFPRSSPPATSSPAVPTWMSTLRQDWGTLSSRARVLVGIAIAASLAAFTALTILRVGPPPEVNAWAGHLVLDAYRREAPVWVNSLFAYVAERSNQVPPSAYVAKAIRLLDSLFAIGGAGLALLLLTAAGSAFRGCVSRLWLEAREVSFREWIHSRFAYLLVLSALTAGIAISIRVIAPLAMVMVAVLFLARHGARALVPLAFYGLLAGLTAVMTWPFLWESPIPHVVESLAFMANHPKMGYVLYMGEVTKGRLLPWHYLPGLMLLQFTEPVWVLFVAGIVAGLRRYAPFRRRVWLMALLGAIWVLVPTLPLTVRHRWLYDNFRQFLFITPAVFLIGGLGLEAVFRKLTSRAIWPVIAILTLLPGVLAVIQLHPYEYVYYNSLVGGSRGATHRFELDYWATSYAEAMRYLNDVLPRDSLIAFWGTTAGAEEIARTDLVLRTFTTEEELKDLAPQVAVILTRANSDLQFLTQAPELKRLTADGALLAVIRVPDPRLAQMLGAR